MICTDILMTSYINNTYSSSLSRINFSRRDNYGNNLLHYACYLGDNDKINFLINDHSIPLNSLKNYILENNEFILEESESEVQDKYKKIQINDELQVKIIGSKYTRKNYACFGELC